MTSPHRAREGRAHHHASRLTSYQVSSFLLILPNHCIRVGVLLLLLLLAECNGQFKLSGHMAVSSSLLFCDTSVLQNHLFYLLYIHAPFSSAQIEESGFETATVADILKSKGKSADGSWLWCTTDDSVYDAVKSMTQHNVGALVVVKPGQDKSIAGIVTERDYLRKIIVQGRSSKSTKVGDIMTEENQLITVKPDTRVLQAMQLMTEKRIRHIPVIDGTGMVGMVSIGDIVRAVVSEHREELNRLNAYIQGGY
uniref:CBS domain-containing protein n=1 Tax=Oryza rufipogon TaxID=4529 RepID=A0A0E0P0Z6_ORYRU